MSSVAESFLSLSLQSSTGSAIAKPGTSSSYFISIKLVLLYSSQCHRYHCDGVVWIYVCIPSQPDLTVVVVRELGQRIVNRHQGDVMRARSCNVNRLSGGGDKIAERVTAIVSYDRVVGSFILGTALNFLMQNDVLSE